ncbi:J517_1871 family lipoprotein [Acinetobacter calcoaceticus]|uniref:J517_1871 family lipoprotein n=1 Tax=Acinetobacter calcoaceticus TaxID=471 RepID=UPI00192C6A63|nr:J517_1871 family lipoprotein [Acinetobacter calcoaceticus]
MKKIVLLFCFLGLNGCAVTNDIIHNQYKTVTPTSSDLNGFWSGKNDSYTVTYSFNKDGTGLVCFSDKGEDTIEKLKVHGNEIIFQSGLKQTIESRSYKHLELKVNYSEGKTFQYTPDPNLANASLYCKSVLNK